MVFLRKKDIHGSKYWYLCRSKREGDTVKQETLAYLGPCNKLSEREAEEKALKSPEVDSETFEEPEDKNNAYKVFAERL